LEKKNILDLETLLQLERRVKRATLPPTPLSTSSEIFAFSNLVSRNLKNNGGTNRKNQLLESLDVA
jgi:hypothetical protein